DQQPSGRCSSCPRNSFILRERPPRRRGTSRGAVPPASPGDGRWAMRSGERLRRMRLLLTALSPLALLFGRPQPCVAGQTSSPVAPAVPAVAADEHAGVPIIPNGGRSVRISLEEHR